MQWRDQLGALMLMAAGAALSLWLVGVAQLQAYPMVPAAVLLSGLFATAVLAVHIRNSRQRYCHWRQSSRQQRRQLRRIQQSIAELQRHDAETGLANRRCFQELLQQEWCRGARERSYLSLILVQLEIDSGEHLQDVARLLREQVRRPADLVARLETDTFALLLPATDGAAIALAEQIRTRLAMGAVVNVGFAATVPLRQQPVSSLLKAAHSALMCCVADSGRDLAVVN